MILTSTNLGYSEGQTILELFDESGHRQYLVIINHFFDNIFVNCYRNRSTDIKVPFSKCVKGFHDSDIKSDLIIKSILKQVA